MTGDLAARPRVVVDAPEVVAVGHRRERPVERKNFQPEARQVKLANDLRPQERDHVRADRELEARKDFFSDRRAAEHVPTLKNQNALAGARQVRRVHQPVVPAADDDGVVSSVHVSGEITYSLTEESPAYI